jgi:hypothetical protein
MAVGWAFLSNGAVAVAAAPPPSAAFPYQDITHFGSLVLGGLAAYATWRKMRMEGIRLDRPAFLFSLVLILIANGFSGILALSNL